MVSILETVGVWRWNSGIRFSRQKFTLFFSVHSADGSVLRGVIFQWLLSRPVNLTSYWFTCCGCRDDLLSLDNHFWTTLCTIHLVCFLSLSPQSPHGTVQSPNYSWHSRITVNHWKETMNWLFKFYMFSIIWFNFTWFYVVFHFKSLPNICWQFHGNPLIVLWGGNGFWDHSSQLNNKIWTSAPWSRRVAPVGTLFTVGASRQSVTR